MVPPKLIRHFGTFGVIPSGHTPTLLLEPGADVERPIGSSALPQRETSVLDRLQYPKGLVQRQHNTAGNRVVEGIATTHSVSMTAACDGAPK
jgi:hypothetical protein